LSRAIRRRTRIVYDHAGHFGKHFPELAKKGLSQRIPSTCSTCHDSSADKRLMSVAPFEKTCAACHLDQILGDERVSGPKGIALLTLPGLDVQTLRKKKAPIGEWPEASEAELTPFMKMMIGRGARGSKLLKTLGTLNLQDLSRASDLQVKAVSELAWEIKQLFHRLMTGKASDLLADLDIDGGSKLTPSQIADLAASLPRDVIIGAQRQWLPNLASELASRPAASQASASVTASASRKQSPHAPVADPPKAPVAPPETSGRDAPQATRQPDPANADANGKAAVKKVAAGQQRPQPRTGDQTDDLLQLTAEELRAMTAQAKSLGKAAPAAEAGRAAEGVASATAIAPTRGGSNATGRAPASPPAAASAGDSKPTEKIAPTSEIQGDMDPETWADVGGWYRQDYAISYRPVGHKDKFITSWISLTSRAALPGAATPAAGIFNALTGKDAQGSCVKCHSVDDAGSHGRRVNFSPLGKAAKQGRFTAFVHEPHIAQAPRGCVTCHALEKGKPYLESYKESDPKNSVSNFGALKKEVCATCHKSSAARQDCLTCHTYHVNGVVTPMPGTKLTAE